jgi:nitrate/nitrite transporter NarK
MFHNLSAGPVREQPHLVCLDIGGKKTGTVSAAMNTAGNFGGFVSTNAFPLLRRLTGSPATYFHAAALLNLVSIACWWSMRSLDTPKAGEAVRT